MFFYYKYIILLYYNCKYNYNNKIIECLLINKIILNKKCFNFIFIIYIN